MRGSQRGPERRLEAALSLFGGELVVGSRPRHEGVKSMVDTAGQSLEDILPDAKLQSEFYEALGRGIAAWQRVEASLCQLYIIAVQPAIPGAATASFYAAQSFSMKLSLTDAAMRFSLMGKDEALSTWEKLKAKMNKKNERRNEMAHLAVSYTNHEKNRDDKIKLATNIMDTRYFAKGLKIERKLSEIKHIITRFDALASEACQFARPLRLVTTKVALRYR